MANLIRPKCRECGAAMKALYEASPRGVSYLATGRGNGEEPLFKCCGVVAVGRIGKRRFSVAQGGE